MLDHCKCYLGSVAISSGLVIGTGVLACVELGYLFPDKDKKEDKIMTTRLTGGLNQGYKPKLPASA